MDLGALRCCGRFPCKLDLGIRLCFGIPANILCSFSLPWHVVSMKLWNEWQNRHIHTRFKVFNYKRCLYATATSQVRMKRHANEAAAHNTPCSGHTYAALHEAIHPKKPVISQVRHRIATDRPRECHAYAI